MLSKIFYSFVLKLLKMKLSKKQKGIILKMSDGFKLIENPMSAGNIFTLRKGNIINCVNKNTIKSLESNSFIEINPMWVNAALREWRLTDLGKSIQS